MGDLGSYVYLTTRDVSDEAVSGITGLSHAPVRVVRSGRLAAVVSSVELAEFGEQPIRDNLENIEWLEQVARTHHEVVERVSRIATVAPWRLATILLDDARVAAMLEDWATDLEATLDRVRDCDEWSVKVYLDRAADEAASNGRPTPGTGTDYLNRRRSELAQQAESADAASAAAAKLHDDLGRHVVASRRLPPQDRQLTGDRGEMVHNGAYLVERDLGQEFGVRVGRISSEHPGLRVQLDGPWPPYSFATLEPKGS